MSWGYVLAVLQMAPNEPPPWASVGEFAVLVYLANEVRSPADHCFPSKASIARALKISERSVYNHLISL